MKLESNKIYKFYHYKNPLLPTLSIKGSAEVYMSLLPEKPSSIDDMIKIEGFENNTINSIIGMIRWICVVFDPTSEVEEDGLISNPFSFKREIQRQPEPIFFAGDKPVYVDDQGNYLIG